MVIHTKIDCLHEEIQYSQKKKYFIDLILQLK